MSTFEDSITTALHPKKKVEINRDLAGAKAKPDVKKYLCPWNRQAMCASCSLGECNVYVNGMKEYHRPAKKVQRRNKMEGCVHNIITVVMEMCSHCGLVHDDFDNQGYHFPVPVQESMLENAKKRGNQSVLQKRGTVRK